MVYDFYTRFARILNSHQTRSVVVTGNVNDLFWDGNSYVPIIPFLTNKTKGDKIIQLTYELNAPVRVGGTPDEQKASRQKLLEAWIKTKAGVDLNDLAMKEALA